MAERTYRMQLRQSSNEKNVRRRAFELLKEYVKSQGDDDVLIADVPNAVIVNNVRLVLKSEFYRVYIDTSPITSCKQPKPTHATNI
jgi:hypothetical protein